MNILGISGLEGAVDFKRAHWPGLEEREYRISQGHDAAAALVVDGVPVAAAAEERFDRRKHSARFPVGAIRYCLAQARLERVRELDGACGARMLEALAGELLPARLVEHRRPRLDLAHLRGRGTHGLP